MAVPMQRRRSSVLLVLGLALALALMHPKHPEGSDESIDLHQQHYMAVAQEVHHGHFQLGPIGGTKPSPPTDAEVEAKVAEAENASVSLTLLGCVGFVMATFYLVNFPDEDIQRISLEVINSTISVFGALLLFHSMQELLEEYVLPELSIWQEVLLSMLQMFLWFGLLQLVLAYYSGAVGKNEVVMMRNDSCLAIQKCRTPRRRAMLQKSSNQHWHAIKLNTEAWGILLGHATGFAAKNACSIMQQAVPRSFFFVAAMPVASFLMISMIYRATDWLRYKKTMADGVEDEFEALWRHRAAETEDEVISLAVSFVVVQMFRFGVSGHLPNAAGEDEEVHWHSDWSCALLLLVGLVPGVADMVRILCNRSVGEFKRIISGEGEEEEQRCRNWLEGISSMCFAWCIHFAVDWWIESHSNLEGSMRAVISALSVTALAFSLIFVLDKVADMHFDDKELFRALRGMISGLGLLVGFSWERCFDASVEGLASHHYMGNLPPALNRMALAVVLAIMVLPAWKWYILPMLHREDEEEHSSESQEPHLPCLLDRLGSLDEDKLDGGAKKVLRKYSSLSSQGSLRDLGSLNLISA